MPAARFTRGLASAAGAATLALLGGCDRLAAPAAIAAAPTASSPALADTLAVADDPDAEPPRRGAGPFGQGIRPTGSTANGITP